MEESNWTKISNEIGDVSKKIKNKIEEENLVDDLKSSLSDSVENISEILKNIISTIESTISDEEIKLQTKDVIKEVNHEFEQLLNTSKKNFDNYIGNSKDNEEE